MRESGKRGKDIRAILVGSFLPLGKHGVSSGIFKQALDRPVKVTFTGLVGDEQGDRKHHGGPEKAIHHYPFDHYAVWKDELPVLKASLDSEGAFGENISTVGMTEIDVCIGDIYRIGTAVVEVSQARQPCWRLNERFGLKLMARHVQESGRTGWYYRVLEEGQIGPGDRIELLDRPAECWTLKRALHVLYRDTLNVDELTQLAELVPLVEAWRVLARRRLERRAIEDWSRRLSTPEQAPP